MGWNYIVGDASEDITEAITFPAAFSAAPIIFMQFIGQRSTASGTPTGTAWFTTLSSAAITSQPYAATTTGFTAALMAENAVNFAADQNYGYTWLAIGTV